jgi:subtilisin family serine protease
VIVAVIDTGVDYLHSELAGSIWTNDDLAGNGIDDDGNGYVDDLYGWDFAYGDADPMDVHGHGTHVSGTIAAAQNGFGATGVAFGALIMPVQVLDIGGSGTWEAIADGIRYAVDNGADIINLSLGGGYSAIIASALAYADQMGVFVAAASGNDSASTPGYPAYHSGELDNVLSVGAHDVNDRRAWFSNRVGGSGAVQIDAPGAGVYSSVPGNTYATWDGTSMAAPHVAGVAALVLEANPNLTPSQLRALLVDGATRSILGSDSAGGLNAAMSVAMALDITAQAFGGDSDSAPAAGVQLANVLSIRAVDSLFGSDMNYMPARGIGIPSADCEPQMMNVPVTASTHALLGLVATDVHSADSDRDEVAPVDAAFESLWDEMDLELAGLQLV